MIATLRLLIDQAVKLEHVSWTDSKCTHTDADAAHTSVGGCVDQKEGPVSPDKEEACMPLSAPGGLAKEDKPIPICGGGDGGRACDVRVGLDGGSQCVADQCREELGLLFGAPVVAKRLVAQHIVQLRNSCNRRVFPRELLWTR